MLENNKYLTNKDPVALQYSNTMIGGIEKIMRRTVLHKIRYWTVSGYETVY